MKLILYTLPLLLFLSCTKNSEHELEISTKYFLNFTVSDSLYFEQQDSISVESTQDLEFETVFIEAPYSKHKYPYFHNDNASQDSVDIIVTIRFRKEGISMFEQSTYDIEFAVSEALINLDKIGEKTYKYFDNSILYNQLKLNNFGKKNLFNNPNKSTMLVTFPESEELLFESPPNHTLTSNGFYFPHENLELTLIQYNETENTITLKGNFDVEIKMLGCGFYSTHAISNAEFQLIIN